MIIDKNKINKIDKTFETSVNKTFKSSTRTPAPYIDESTGKIKNPSGQIFGYARVS